MTHICVVIYRGYEGWQKSFDTNIGPIQYLKNPGIYYSTFDIGIKSREIIISYEKI